MELADDPLIPNEEPPWFEIIPIYDFLPQIFRIKDGLNVAYTKALNRREALEIFKVQGHKDLTVKDIKRGYNNGA